MWSLNLSLWGLYPRVEFSIEIQCKIQVWATYVTLSVLVKVKVTQSCPSLWDPTDYTVHGILQARILEWVTFPFFRGSSQPRDQIQVSRITGRFFTNWAIRENKKRELPGGPVVKIPSLHWRGHGLKPWPGNFLEARWYRQKNFFLMHKK